MSKNLNMITFKFKNEKQPDSITIEGDYISYDKLKEKIAKFKDLGKPNRY